jgi:type I restriction enzyme M protein
LYRSGDNGALAGDQSGTILGEWLQFQHSPDNYRGRLRPDCAAIWFSELWQAHTSHRLDPKYHLFKIHGVGEVPTEWTRERLGDVLERRHEEADFQSDPDVLFQVMTISQTGEIRAREAGKGHNPPEWRASYFEESPGSWYVARVGDVVFSSIDLWKGCIALVPPEFDGALVTHEFPIYQVRDGRLTPSFLQILLRSRYYQRAFRAITTGHSNRRRTQVPDFEDLEIAFPTDTQEQERLTGEIAQARVTQNQASAALRAALTTFSDIVDGRGDEELPEVDSVLAEDE